jgi:hypothetical protein
VNAYRCQVAEALQALAIESSTSYRWLDVRYAVSGPGETAHERLTAALEDRLYRDFYCRGRPMRENAVATRPLAARAEFIEALSAANRGTVVWSSGWSVLPGPQDGIIAQRDGLELVAETGRYILAEDGSATLLLPPERFAAAPGYYVAVGEREWDPSRASRSARIYFNVLDRTAERLVAVVTQHLNRARIPFTLKVLDEPLIFFRCDSAVLFLPDGTDDALRAIVRAMGRWLDSDVPALTRQVATGIAVADTPPGESFGANRCGLIAAGAVDAFRAGTTMLEDRVDAVAERFTDAGLKLDAPYLGRARQRSYLTQHYPCERLVEVGDAR